MLGRVVYKRDFIERWLKDPENRMKLERLDYLLKGDVKRVSWFGDAPIRPTYTVRVAVNPETGNVVISDYSEAGIWSGGWANKKRGYESFDVPAYLAIKLLAENHPELVIKFPASDRSIYHLHNDIIEYLGADPKALGIDEDKREASVKGIYEFFNKILR